MAIVLPVQLAWPPKDPGEIDDYDINWLPRLGTDTILTSVWSITSPPTGSSLVINSSSFTANRTKVWLSGGLLGQTTVLQNTVTTANGDTLIQSVSIVCRAK